MAVGDAHVFPGFLTPILTQLYFPKQPTTFLACFCRAERRTNAGEKVRAILTFDIREMKVVNGTSTHIGQINKFRKMLCFKTTFINKYCNLEILLLEMKNITVTWKYFYSLRIMYHAHYSLEKSRANLPAIKLNFSVCNAFLRQPAM